MSPRQDVSEERQEQILDAAASVFARLGFEDARMDDIAAESGLSKGSLYWYFKSKDDIIVALMHRVFSREMADIQALLEMSGTVAERLETFVEAAVQDIENLGILIPIMYEFYATATRREEMRKFFQGYFSDYRGALAALLQQGVTRGEVPAGTDIKTAAIVLSAVVEGVLILSIVEPEVRIQEHIVSSMRLVMRGVIAGSK